MAIARQDLVVAAEILVDGLRLGRRFDDDDVHARDQKEATALTSGLAERNLVARMTLDAAGKFQFEQQGGDGGG